MYSKQERISLVLRLIALFVSLGITLMIFSSYIQKNNDQVNKSNKLFLESYSTGKVNSINIVLNEGLDYTVGMANFYSTMVTQRVLDTYILKQIEDSSDFESVIYVDAKAQAYTSQGVIYDVSDKEYFYEGIKGNQGILWENDNETKLLRFYATVYYLKKPCGVLVCSYNMDQFEDIITGQIYGVDAYAIIVDNNYDIIAASHNLSQKGRNANKKEEIAYLYSLFEKTPEEKIIEVDFQNNERLVCIAQIETTDWLFVQEFPIEAKQSIEDIIKTMGAELVFNIVAVFLLYTVIVAVYHAIRYRVTLKDNRNKDYIYKGTGRVFSKFALIDFEEGTYEYLHASPNDTSVAKKGPVRDIISYFERMIIEPEMKEAFKVTFEPTSIRERLEKDDRVFTCNLHVMNPSEYWDTISIMAIEWKQGKVVKALVTNQHITDMKKKEERDRLALVEALTSAKEASKAKSDFLSNMSHDIRTPMNAIVGFATLINKEAEIPEKVREYAKKITASSSHLLGLINDILDMSKIESGKTVLNYENFNIENMLSDIEDIILPQMQQNGKQFEINIHDIEDCNVRADKLRIQQILINLLSNAMKYTREDGKVVFEVFEQNVVQNNKYANMKFIIKDNGIGMDEEFQKHIFESFTREISSVTNKIQGTGLGMAITKNLVDMMNGTIIVESKKGEGSTFEVTLPLEIIEVEVEVDQKAVEEVVDDNPLEGMKFLVVEDNEINYTVISSLLEMKDASSMRAENGQEALEIFKNSCKDDFDMIFMDVQMPIMNGYEATKAIRSLDTPWAKEIPIIAMTANAFAEDVANAMDSGMNAHVSKPIDMDVLASTVKKLKI